MAVTHMHNSPAFVTFCGLPPRASQQRTTDPSEVTCLKCPDTLRWLINVKGLTWEQANREKKGEYETRRQERMADRRPWFGFS